MKFKQGHKVKLMPARLKRKPLSPGQHKPDGSIPVMHNGTAARLQVNRVYQVSENTSAGIVNEDFSPLPLISADFLNKTKLNARFKLIDGDKQTKPDNDE